MGNRAKEREFRYGYLPSYDEGLKILEGVKHPDVLVATKAAVNFNIYRDNQGWLWRHLIPAFHTHQDYTYFRKLVIKLLTDHHKAIGDENQDHIEIEAQALREQALADAERTLCNDLPDTLGMIGILKSLYSHGQLREIIAGLGIPADPEHNGSPDIGATFGQAREDVKTPEFTDDEDDYVFLNDLDREIFKILDKDHDETKGDDYYGMTLREIRCACHDLNRRITTIDQVEASLNRLVASNDCTYRVDCRYEGDNGEIEIPLDETHWMVF